MYQPLSKEDVLKELQRLERRGISFDKAIQNIALLHYVAEQENLPAGRLLQDWQFRQAVYPALA